MRLIISSSGMMVIIILIVIIHNSIISDNYCNMEMNSSINGAFDYALDKVSDGYITGEYDDIPDDVFTTQLMRSFCKSFNEAVSSDAEYTVTLLYADRTAMLYDIAIEAEEYSEVLAEVLKGHFNGTLDETKYFYNTFDEMYKEMEEQ